MTSEHKSNAVRNFWKQWKATGDEILEHGEQVQYGQSLLEVKYMDSVPAVIILSKSYKTKYPDNQTAKSAIGKILEDSESIGFTGSRTFTVTLNKGTISQVLLDQYGNSLIDLK